MIRDREEREGSKNSEGGVTEGVRLEAARLLNMEGKIAAIKYVREKKGLGLVRAKAYVEALGAGRNPDEAARAVQPSGSGCLIVVLFVLVAVALAVWWFAS